MASYYYSYYSKDMLFKTTKQCIQNSIFLYSLIKLSDMQAVIKKGILLFPENNGK